MSKLDRKTGIKKLRYRGFARVRLAVVLKALAINILRAAAALPTLLFNVIATFILFFKELFQKNVRVWYFCSPEPAWEAFLISAFLRGHQTLQGNNFQYPYISLIPILFQKCINNPWPCDNRFDFLLVKLH